MKRRSFLTLAFRAAATVACLGVARIAISAPKEAPYFDWQSCQLYLPEGEWIGSFMAKLPFEDSEWHEVEFKVTQGRDGFWSPFWDYGEGLKVSGLRVNYAGPVKRLVRLTT